MCAMNFKCGNLLPVGFHRHGEGGSSIVRVPGDVPPVRIYFFRLLIGPRVYFLAILV